MNPPPNQLGFSSRSRPFLDLNIVPTEELMEIDGPPTPAAPAALRLQPPDLNMRYTVQCIFREYSSRRAALITAITTDEDELFRKCDPSLEPMQLYGHTDGSWEVRRPELHKQPPRQPEPTLGFNLKRNNMERVEWLQELAKHCDAWLVTISFFDGAKLLNANGREHLFNSINCLRTVYEAFMNSDTYCRLSLRERQATSTSVNEDEQDENENVSEEARVDFEGARNDVEEVGNDNVLEEGGVDFEGARNDVEEVENGDDSEEVSNDCKEAGIVNAFEEDSKEVEDNKDYFCQICGGRYHANGFWICCDYCTDWFHGRCVQVKPHQAEIIEKFKCPNCKDDYNGHDED